MDSLDACLLSPPSCRGTRHSPPMQYRYTAVNNLKLSIASIFNIGRSNKHLWQTCSSGNIFKSSKTCWRSSVGKRTPLAMRAFLSLRPTTIFTTDSASSLASERGSPLYKLFGAGWGQKGVGGFFLKIRPHSCV